MMSNFEEQILEFNQNVTELSQHNSIPKWFKPFLNSFKTFSNVVSTYFTEAENKFKVMEGSLAVQKAVTDSLVLDRDRLSKSVEMLEDKVDELEQYSRRTCLLIHGVEEKAKEDVEKTVMSILETKLEAGVTVNEVTRTHRLGRKRDEQSKKPRPIIVKFLSYRQRKKVFNNKKKLKGQGIVISENLTKKRYSLLQKCIDIHGKHNCWSLDGRIYCKTDGIITIVNKEVDLVNPRD